MRNIYCFFLFITTFSSYGASWYVNDATTDGDMFTTAIGTVGGTGTSSNPFLTFGAALAAASAGDAIYVDAGLYTGGISYSLNKANLAVIGAGADRTLFDNMSASANTNYFGIITANGVSVSNMRFSRYNNVNNSLGQKVLGVSGATGVTLTNLQFDNSSASGGGAALILASGASVAIEGGSYACNAESGGNFNGAIGIEGASSLTINNALIHNNGSTQRGAGIDIIGGGSLTVTGCTFTENTGAYGGAICARGTTANGCTLSVSDSWFEENQANAGSTIWSGGAIAIGKSVTATIENCMFKSNSAPGGTGSSDGGAISVEGAVGGTGSTSVEIITCTFDGNTAADDGKAIYADETSDAITILIDNCTFTNQAANFAIAQRTSGEAEFTIRNSGSPTVESTVNSPGPGVVNTTSPSSSTTATKITANGSCPTFGQDLSLLPVQFTTFTARPVQRTAMLRWQTATETNNEGFFVQHSTDGRHWQDLAFVAGHGDSQSPREYEFLHEKPYTGNNYYRLLQMDYDGRTAHSPVAQVAFGTTQGGSARLFPVPAHTQLTLSLDQAYEAPLTVSVFRTTGQLVATHYIASLQTQVDIEVAHLPSGVYAVHITGDGVLLPTLRWMK